MSLKKVIASSVVVLLLTLLVLTGKTFAVNTSGIMNSTLKNIQSNLALRNVITTVGAEDPSNERPIILTVERSVVGEWTSQVTLKFTYRCVNNLKSLTITKQDTGAVLDKYEPYSGTQSGMHSFTVTENGVYDCVAEDEEGNTFKLSVTVSNIGEPEPSGVPTINIGNATEDGKWVKERVLTISVSDPKGIKEVTAGVDGSDEVTKLSTTENEGTEKTYTYTVTKNNTKYAFVAINLRDGKKTSRITFHYIDSVAPTDDAPTVSKGTSNTKIVVTCNQKDNESGIEKRELKITKNGAVVITNETIPSEIDLGGEGEFKVQTITTDKVGNQTISKETTYNTSSGEPTPSPSTDPTPSPSTDPTPSPSEPQQGEIKTDKYSVDYNQKILSRVLPNTDLADFKKNIKVEGGVYTIVTDNNEGVTEGVIKSGYKIRTSNNTYTISVIGDIAPNGQIDILDLAKLRAHIIQMSGQTLTGISLVSADISGDGSVNIIDLARLRAIIIGTMTLE